jgi:hypothetical protein
MSMSRERQGQDEIARRIWTPPGGKLVKLIRPSVHNVIGACDLLEIGKRRCPIFEGLDSIIFYRTQANPVYYTSKKLLVKQNQG